MLSVLRLAHAVAPGMAPRGLILRDILVQQEGAEARSQHELASHLLSAFRPNIGVGRLCRPEDVALIVVFVASNGAGFIAGTNLRVEGGSVTTI